MISTADKLDLQAIIMITLGAAITAKRPAIFLVWAHCELVIAATSTYAHPKRSLLMGELLAALEGATAAAVAGSTANVSIVHVSNSIEI